MKCCESCGQHIKMNAIYCPHCGAEQTRVGIQSEDDVSTIYGVAIGPPMFDKDTSPSEDTPPIDIPIVEVPLSPPMNEVPLYSPPKRESATDSSPSEGFFSRIWKKLFGKG